MKTYNNIYLSVRNALMRGGIEAYSLEAKLLTAYAAGKSVTELIRDLNLYTTDAVEAKAMEYAERHLKGEPVAYITGSWEFYGLPMVVTPDVLIPRMDTEVLVSAAMELLHGRKMDARILDLCCGSGCISCALARELPASRVVAADISSLALEVTRRNASVLNVSNRVLTLQADALATPPMRIGSFDIIVSNPPYIPSAEILSLDSSVRDHEPIWALDGGEDGLKFYRAILKHWQTTLREGGYLLFEVGEGQAADVAELMDFAGFRTVTTRKDTLGVDRVVIGQAY